MKELIAKLRENKIHISLENENLKLKFDDQNIPSSILEEIKKNKDQIIQFLKNNNQSNNLISFIPKTKLQEDYVLSSTQYLIWLLSQIDKGGVSYNITELFRLKGNLNIEIFELAIKKIIERHEILRTIFKQNSISEVRQCIIPIPDFRFALNYIMISSLEDAKNELKSIIDNEIEYQFDLSTGPLFRVSLIRVNSNEIILCFVAHHIICDGWSINLLINEILTLYNAFSKNQTIQLNPLRIQYKDYSEWQQNNLKNGLLEKHRLFWKNQFDSDVPVLELPASKPRPIIKTYNGNTLWYNYPEDFLNKLKRISKNNDTTLFSTLISIINLMLYKYSGKDDIVLGTIIAGRENQELENQIGMYVNTLAIRTKFNTSGSFSELIDKQKNVLIQAFQYQEYPFNELVNDLKLKRDKSRSPLFDVLVILQNQNQIYLSEIKIKDLEITPINDSQNSMSQFDMRFEFFELKNELKLSLEYNTDIYDEFLIRRIFYHFQNIVDSITQNPDQLIKYLNYLSKEEIDQLLYDFNNKNVFSEPKIYILSNNLELKPIASVGNIYVNKDYGFSNLKEGISNPFCLDEKIYDTGIIGKWLPDGTIKFSNVKEEELIVTKKSFVDYIQHLKLFKVTECKKIKILSSFTAEPIKDSLSWLLKEFELNHELEFGAYHQFFQEYIELKNNNKFTKSDVLLILNRFEDYIGEGQEDEIIETLNLVCDNTIDILKKERLNTTILYIIFPINYNNVSAKISAQISNLNKKIIKNLKNISNVYTIDIQNNFSHLIFDEIGYKNAKIPFSEEFFFDISYDILRTLWAALNKNAFKVIALDCDNTLWNGVCGEDSLDEIKISEGHKYLQEFMIQKYNEGFMLVLLSKNNDNDVWNIFDNHPDMVLKKEHIISSKINWEQKTENIKSLSKELKLGLDSFIFIDDNPFECHQMMQNNPEVLSLELPENQNNFKIFLHKVIAFDKLDVTNEDLNRNEMYKAETRRDKVKETLGLETFLNNLNLELSFKTAEKYELERVSQLSFRTNQFNLNGIKRTEQEIDTLIKNGYRCYVIYVRDRFGDYGLVGSLIFQIDQDSIIIHSLMLSCRALGRGVEDAIMAQLKKILINNGYKIIYANFIDTNKNKPFKEYIINTKWDILNNEDGLSIKISAEDISSNINYIKIYFEQNLPIQESTELISEYYGEFGFDHIGIAVRDIFETKMKYEALGFHFGNQVFDPIQNCNLIMGSHANYYKIELIEGVGQNSPTRNILNSNHSIPYHVCYKVKNHEKTLNYFKKNDFSFEIIKEPQPAILFNNLNVLFIYNKDMGLIELIEDDEGKEHTETLSIKTKNLPIIEVVSKNLKDTENAYKVLGYRSRISESGELILRSEKLGEIIVIDTQSKLNTLKDVGVNRLLLNREYFNNIKVEELENYIVIQDFQPFKQSEKWTWNKNLINQNNLLHKKVYKALGTFYFKKFKETTTQKVNEYNSINFEEPRNEEEKILCDIFKEVLNLEKISINDDFFDLGGHSLNAIRIISKIFKEFNIEISLNNFFKYSSIKLLSGYILKQQAILINKTERIIFVNIKPIISQEYYELSPSQQRLWLVDNIGLYKASYNIYGIYYFNEDIDYNLYKQSIKKLINRHEILRTIFIEIDGEPKQKILDLEQLDFNLEFIDTSQNKEAETRLNDIEQKLFSYSFKLDSWPLFKLIFLKDSTGYKLLYSVHHIITDGWSTEIFIRDLSAIYQSELTGNPALLPNLKVQYKDYAHWQNEMILNDGMHAQEEYWTSQFKTPLPKIHLPYDYEYSISQTNNNAGYYDLFINKSLKNKIHQFLIQKRINLFTLFVTCFKILLNRLTQEDDLIIGIPIANRDHEDIKDLIGFFLNTLMLRDKLEKNSSFEKFLNQVNNTLINGLQNQSYPFEKLLEKINIERDYNNFPLSPVFLNMLNFSSKEEKSTHTISEHRQIIGASKFDIECYFKEYENGISIACVYNNNLFKSQTIEYWLKEFVAIIEQGISNSSIEIKKINIFGKTQFETRVPRPLNSFTHFNDESVNQSIIARFEEQVKKYPNNIAINQDDKSISYFELNALSNGLAEKIIITTKIRKSNIALLLDHGTAAIVGMLGVLKSGNVYIPLDPDYPFDRLKYMLKDANCELIIVTSKTVDLAKTLIKDLEAVLIVNISDGITPRQTNLNVQINPENKAYILYTSGSTGEPKGVIQIHKNILHFIRIYTNNLHISISDRISLLPTYSFDSSVMDIYGALLNGASLYPYNLKQKGIETLAGWIQANKISIFHTVPTIYRYFIATLSDDVFKYIRLVVLGGEAVYKNDFENFKKYFVENSIFINGYGPTESTITLQKFLDHKSVLTTTNIPIGFPVKETDVYLLNENDEMVGIYQIGEMVYKSNYLSLGYLNKDSQTKSVFTIDPITDNGNVYRSGDLGRMLPTGEIEFIGRKDGQIKLHGQRIETSEIEQNLLQIEGIDESVVLMKVLGKQDNLVAYIRSKNKLNINIIKNKLSLRLPRYMVPNIYIFVDEFLLTPTGKINRSSLPEPTEKEIQNNEYVAPESEIEKKLVDIWKYLLNKKKIGIKDNFFEVGGNSLKAIQLISRIKKEFDINISLIMLFNNPTIEGINDEIQKTYWVNGMLLESNISDIEKISI